MDTQNGSNKNVEPKENAGSSRRAVLKTATAGAVAGVSAVLAGSIVAGASPDEPSTVARFGAPVVELHVPAGVLTLEQKADMINGITSVLIAAIKLPPDVNQQLWVQIFETAQGGWGLGGQVYVPRGQ
jgi:phenylpyruvate tautomerase PptA (4-oxalocrotonate tautomerase family)